MPSCLRKYVAIVIDTSSWRARTAGEWDETVDVMLRHMEARGGAYNKEEIQTIRAYLKRNAN